MTVFVKMKRKLSMSEWTGLTSFYISDL